MDMVECDGTNSNSSSSSIGSGGGDGGGAAGSHTVIPDHRREIAHCFAPLVSDVPKPFSSWHEMLFSCTGRLALDAEGGMSKLVHMESFRHKVHPTSYWQTWALTLLQNMHMVY
ncbi:hypothetical protein HZH68_003416 [Vespula germanica]|uniref:Uncharacterized protein n=1 Tax=Vespula germanica TaxID=30212 RepID=A0A834U366_VESGE|nr:hypothetical protein HZH68_003416 [Vespula germanica]